VKYDPPSITKISKACLGAKLYSDPIKGFLPHIHAFVGRKKTTKFYILALFSPKRKLEGGGQILVAHWHCSCTLGLFAICQAEGKMPDQRQYGGSLFSETALYYAKLYLFILL